MAYKYIALIPAYKPTAFLPDMLRKLKSFGFSIVLIDDGSGDEYKEIFDLCSDYAIVLHHAANAGKGCALKTGLTYIAEHCAPDCLIVTVDADGQHRVDDALALCQIAQQNPHTLVLGSRGLKENAPLRSRFGNTVTRFVYRISTGVKIYDTQTGLRAFDMSLVPKLLTISGERYEYEMNVLLQFANDRIPMKEHTIETIYIDNNSASHFDVVKDSVRIYKEILKFSASSFIGFIVDYTMYSLILLLTGNLRASNIGARMISAGVNFTLNHKFVFKSRENIRKAALKYFLLAAGILFGNTLVLKFLVNTCNIHQMLAKFLTELLFFTLSWLIQRLVIFKRRTGGDRK